MDARDEPGHDGGWDWFGHDGGWNVARAYVVMAGPVPAIHVFVDGPEQDVDARDEPGHDGVWVG